MSDVTRVITLGIGPAATIDGLVLIGLNPWTIPDVPGCLALTDTSLHGITLADALFGSITATDAGVGSVVVSDQKVGCD